MRNRSATLAVLLAIHAVLLATPAPALAFIINPGVQFWLNTASGTRNANGDPVTLTWSFAPEGTTIVDNSTGGFGNLGGSDLISTLDATFGGDPNGNFNADLRSRPWFTYFEQSFQRWEDLSGADYVYEPNDDGAIAGSSSPAGVLGVRGDLRLAGASIDGVSSVLAFNYFPENGDMVLDTDDFAGIYSNSANNFRGLRNVIMHEHGHGLGLEHVLSTTDDLLLEPFIDLSFDGPQLDDVRAIQFYFGDANEKTNGGQGNDIFSHATPLGTLGVGGSTSIGSDADVPTQAISGTVTDFVSLANITDTDFYSFEVNEGALLTATLTPHGGTFTQSPDPGTPTSFNASARSDLILAIFDTDGITPLGTANLTPAGGIETLVDLVLPTAGEYFARITGADDTIQLYELELEITSPLVFDAADFDTDGDVDDADLAIWQAAFGTSTAGDANGDNQTNGLDFLLWQQQYTGTLVPISAVPEPSAFLLFGAGGLCVLRFRNRCK